MSIILAAVALAGVQATPPADPHAGHAQMQGHAQTQAQGGKAAEHKMDCCKEAECKECCKGMHGSKPEHSGHSDAH